MMNRLLTMRLRTRIVAPLVAGAVLAVMFADVTARTPQSIPQSVVDGVIDAVCRKQVVLLGELPTHGEAHAFDAKAKIADRLMTQCGFTAILFEAPTYDFIGMERAVDAGTATPQHLENAIGRFWLSRELSPWRRALFEAAARRRITVGGLDDQVSITSQYARAALPRLVAAAVSERTAMECAEAVSRHVGWTYDAKHPPDDREKRLLNQCVRGARDSAAARPSFDAADRMMLDSFARYAERWHLGATSGRDDSMYRNLAWHLERLPANSRAVVWTATVHAALRRGARSEATLGTRAVERWGEGVAAVGFTAYGGEASMAGRPATRMPDAPPGSLEASTTSDSAWALLDSAKLRTLGRVPSRLLGKFVSESWADLFDLVVVVRQEVAPTFDPWK